MTPEQIKEIRDLQRMFEQKHFQGYIRISFSTSSWSWGDVIFRHEMSGGPNGEVGFRSVNDLFNVLRVLVAEEFN